MGPCGQRFSLRFNNFVLYWPAEDSQLCGEVCKGLKQERSSLLHGHPSGMDLGGLLHGSGMAPLFPAFVLQRSTLSTLMVLYVNMF